MVEETTEKITDSKAQSSYECKVQILCEQIYPFILLLVSEMRKEIKIQS